MLHQVSEIEFYLLGIIFKSFASKVDVKTSVTKVQCCPRISAKVAQEKAPKDYTKVAQELCQKSPKAALTPDDRILTLEYFIEINKC